MDDKRLKKSDLWVGALSGLLAGAVAGQADRLFARFVSREQKRRERKVREASPHQAIGPVLARKVVRREPSEREKRLGQMAFDVGYGVGWGLLYAAARRRRPGFSHAVGLPFAVPFFLACDGAIAPLLKLTPPLQKIPWQPNFKELGNHIVWTATAEMVHRGREKLAA